MNELNANPAEELENRPQESANSKVKRPRARMRVGDATGREKDRRNFLLCEANKISAVQPHAKPADCRILETPPPEKIPQRWPADNRTDEEFSKKNF